MKITKDDIEFVSKKIVVTKYYIKLGTELTVPERDLFDFLDAIYDSSPYFGIRGLDVNSKLKTFLEENDIASHSQGRGWYKKDNYEEFVKMLGWEDELL